MGGLNSGSWYRYDKKDTVEDCRSIDVRRWHKEGYLGSRLRFISWAWYRDEERVASIGAWTSHDKVVLTYTHWRGGWEEDKQDMRYTVPVTWTECNFGGERPWFVCPGVVSGYSCGRRVAKLYAGGRYFLCRHCYDLTYASRQESKRYGPLLKAQKIRQQLGGSANMTLPFPLKPKGMHWRTYERLRWEHDIAEERHALFMLADLERFDRYLSR
ncbi:MAG: hypothetical protein ACR2GU_01375 [Rubrobacteraceae bacterium]